MARFDHVRRGAEGHCVLFDEGITHIPFNLLDYQSERQGDVDEICRRLEGPLRQIHLALIVGGGVDLASRLLGRGHKRVDVTDLARVESFVARNRAVEAALARCYPDKLRGFRTVSAEDAEAHRKIEDIISDAVR